MLAAGDFIALLFGFLLTIVVRYWTATTVTGLGLIFPMFALFFIAILVLFVTGLYDISRTKNTWPFYQKVIIAGIAWFIIGVGFFYLRRASEVNPKTILLFSTIIGFGIVALWRYLYNRFLSTEFIRTNVVFIGMTPEVIEIARIIHNEPERGYRLIGFVTSALPPSDLTGYPREFTLGQLLQNNDQKNPHIIVTADANTKNLELLKELYDQLCRQVSVVNLAKFYETIMSRIPPFTFSESWFLNNLNEQDKKIYDRARILVDYFCAVTMGVVFGITFPLIALIIKTTSDGPIFYSQERTGRMGKKFKIYKYRTMQALTADGGAEVAGPKFAATNDARITKIGKFLRKTRLDEIPQFVNILKNEMAIIGPRPERPEFVAQLSAQMPFYNLRHLIKPGLTGWAQIKESYYGTLEENLRKLEYDLYYVKNRGVSLDIAILLRTISTVLKMGGR